MSEIPQKSNGVPADSHVATDSDWRGAQAVPGKDEGIDFQKGLASRDFGLHLRQKKSRVIMAILT